MSNELVKVQTLPMNSMNDIAEAGKLLSQTGMLGVSDPAEGFIIAATCHQERMSYLEFRETYNIIHGTPSMKADAMLARFNELGGVHRIIERSPNKIEIELEYDGKKNTFAITWDEAKEEPFPYRGKESVQLAELDKPFEERNLKAKYKTPRSRMQMLWARCVSDAVRCICPKANKGSYTKEEVEDYMEADGKVGNQQPKPVTPVQVDEIPVQNTASNAAGTPFEDPDYSVCPIQGCPHTGKQWSDIDAAELEALLQNPFGFAGMEQGHVDAIKNMNTKA